MRYTTLLFDADDTLLDFKRSEHDAISNVLLSVGIPNDDVIISVYSEINDSLWKLLEVGGITKNELKVERFRRLCKHFGFDTSPELMAQKYINALSEQSHMIKGADKICERLSNEGLRLYIITNGIKYIQTRRFAATPLPKFFDGVFISEEVGYEKPSAEFFRCVTSSIDRFDPTKTLVIGDSLSSDIKGGNNAGIDTCWYNPRGKAGRDDVKVTYEIRSLDKIFDILGI